jgi:hypothetical protein
MIHIDQKVTTWQRFSIDEEHREELEKFLKENPEADGSDIYDWASNNDLDPYCESMEGQGLDELISPEENGGQPTLEIISNNEAIYQNA